MPDALYAEVVELVDDLHFLILFSHDAAVLDWLVSCFEAYMCIATCLFYFIFSYSLRRKCESASHHQK